MGQAALRLVEGKGVDKQKALQTALSQIERNFGKGSVMRLGDNQAMDIEAISTGSLGLDIALGIGGLPLPRPLRLTYPKPPPATADICACCKPRLGARSAACATRTASACLELAKRASIALFNLVFTSCIRESTVIFS